MTNLGWSLLNGLSRGLESNEREAVLGDLIEAGESALRGVIDVAGLVFLRHVALWKSWRPWLAGFGAAFPGSLLLMGVSVSVSWKWQGLMGLKVTDGTSAIPVAGLLAPLLCQASLLIAWSWTGGFVVGSVSRRTLWFSAAMCSLPCLFCLMRFREHSLSRLCLLLFLVPAVAGVRHGLRLVRIRFRTALVMALAVTILMLGWWNMRGLPLVSWALIWPAWYIVATAQRSRKNA